MSHGEAWTVTPEVSLTETYSSNMALRSDELRGWISDLAPALHLNGASPKLKANLDYRLDSVHYAGHPELKRNLNSLASSATYEAVDKWLFIDASANVAQRSTSSFTPVATSQGNVAANQAETRTVQIAPYVRGQWSDLAAYQLRFDTIRSQSDDNSLADSRVHQWLWTVKNASAGAKIGWFFDGNATRVSNAVIDSREDTRWRGGLTYEVLPQLTLSLSNGRERTNYASTDLETRATPGAGIEWAPSPKTRMAALGERRFFGNGRSILLSHQTALTDWRYTDTRDVAVLPVLLSAPNQGTVAALMSDLLAASIPDPVARAAAVRARMDQSGVGNAAGGGVQTARLFVNRVREASGALIGARNTVTLSLTQRDQQSLNFVPGVTDGFSQSGDIREQGANVSWVHRLTPLTTLTVASARLRREGVSANLQADQITQTASLSFKASQQATVSIGVRGMRFDSTTNGAFHENAVVGSFSQRF